METLSNQSRLEDTLKRDIQSPNPLTLNGDLSFNSGTGGHCIPSREELSKILRGGDFELEDLPENHLPFDMAYDFGEEELDDELRDELHIPDPHEEQVNAELILVNNLREEIISRYAGKIFERERLLNDIESLASKYSFKVCRNRGITEGKIGIYCEQYGMPRQSQSTGQRIKSSKKIGEDKC